MKIIKAIYNFLGEMGRARAATHLARRGEYENARKLITSDFKGWV
jgi:hypothetical protein